MSIIRMVNNKIADLSTGVDKTIDQWFLMSTPIPLISIVGIYLLFVLKIGPAWMANRKPFDLKTIMILYNAFQVVFSVWLCYTSFQESRIFSHLTSKKCEVKRNRQETLMLYSGAWFYFFSKIIDLLDTTFFVLRKKQNQISFLHVYHHSVTAVASWGYLKYAPGEQGVIIGILNSGVHILMYFYYMVSAMGPKYQKFLWWKKYMTTIQLVQFILIFVYMITIAAKDCKMPKALTFFFLANTLIFLYLFGSFYKNTYKKRKTKDSSLPGVMTNGKFSSAAMTNGKAFPTALTNGNAIPVSMTNGNVTKPKNILMEESEEKKLLDFNNNNSMKATKAD